MASPASSKKQIIQSIKDKKSILVTVSSNPSVDELAAALGLTIFLNKLDKHATAIASGDIPSALDFLDPEKTFEATADSLRDFIIALDKEKADHLRYKLDGDVVKIFITPYRTTISQSDLEFSQGDYNVEMVLALNVANNDDLDKALSAHGKILHDATVATLSIGDTKSSLGTIEWHENKVSGVSEMVTEIVQELKTAKADVDEQIATALLTGIVASTDRFSNDLTSSKVMTMSAELMASGANQQLIASKLQEGEPGSYEPKSRSDGPSTPDEPDQPVKLEENDPTRLSIDRSGDEGATQPVAEKEPTDQPDTEGAMIIGHEREGALDDVAKQVMEQSQEEAARAAEAQLSQIVEPAMVEPVASEPVAAPLADTELAAPSTADSLPQAVPSITEELEQATEQINSDNPIISKATAAEPMASPTVGGTLNATTAAAAEAKRDEVLKDQNRTILTHGTPLASTQPATPTDSPMNAAMATQADEPSVVDIFSTPPNSGPAGGVSAAGSGVDPLMQPDMPSLPAQDEHQSAMADVEAALTAPAEPTASGIPNAAPTLADIEAGAMPPMPDFNNLPPLPPAPLGMDPAAGLPPLPPVPVNDPNKAQEFNPAQFQIPPQ